MVRIVDAHDSLRISILVTLGLHGCAGSSQPSSSGDSTSVVTIAPVTSTTSVPEPIDSSEPGIPVISSKVGWVTENNGNTHRASVVKCDPTNEMQACAGTENRLSCTTDADCKEHPYGKCVTGYGQVGSYCGCQYACASDSDCNEDEACICKGTGRLGAGHSVCAKAFCRVDGDCESKQCSLSIYNNGCSAIPSLACRTKADMCKSDNDCGTQGGQCAVTRPGPDAKWECGRRSCVVGRPLVIEGQTLSAAPTTRHDWQTPVELDVDALEAEKRIVAAEHYLQIAAMEHASVASFARFSLQLLALGAPSDLLHETHRAALDEIEHARIAYALAAQFGKKNVGPDKLPAAVASIQVDIKNFVRALVEEGCVGETLGAAEGRAAAEKASLSLASSLRRIADDEERHATLAWRTLQWALQTFGEPARDAAAEAFAQAMRIYSRDPHAESDIAELGILSGTSLGTLRRHVLSAVIVPCAQALGISASFVASA